jgi:hypothetical protein
MLEIKNIFNREITGIPKEEYWVQTQIQMETCGLDECDFMETRFKQFDTSEDFYQDEQHEYKGVILQFMIRTSNMSTESIANNLSSLNAPIYKYMPIDTLSDKESIENWINQERNNSPEWILFSIHYWYLDEFSCVLIQRNRAWFLTALPIIHETWKTILKERIEGYKHRSSKKRSIKVEKSGECTSQTIKNMPLTNSICLVKLDHNDLLE